MTVEVTVSRESAEAQLDMFMERYRKDTSVYSNVKVNGTSGAEVFEAQREKYLSSIMVGDIEIGDKDGRIVIIQHLVHTYDFSDKLKASGQIVYWPATGQARIEQDKHNGVAAKTFAVLAVLAKEEKSMFIKLEDPDLSTAEEIAGLFLM